MHIKVLHNYGVDVNRRGALGLTALHHACISREATSDAVRLLLTWRANVNMASATGDTALHYACQVNIVIHVENYFLISLKGCLISINTSQEKSDYSAIINYTKICRLILFTRIEYYACNHSF